MEESILIRGARVHNLKNISLAIPHNQLTVVTGVSGSGKSSLAFDTIYAEGQRRYVESLSAYARQFLERMEKPDVDEIDGIAPAHRHPPEKHHAQSALHRRHVHRDLRLSASALRARRAAPTAPTAATASQRDTVDQVAQQHARAAARLALVRAVSGPRRTAERTPCATISSSCARRASTASIRTGASSNSPRPNRCSISISAKPVFILVDRFAISPDLHQRIVDTTEICYREAGEVIFEEATPQNPPPVTLRFSEKFACKHCGIELVTPEPGLFSFNNPIGACPRCQGFGNTIDYDMDLVIPNPGLSLDEGAVDPWTKPQYESWPGAFQERPRAARCA